MKKKKIIKVFKIIEERFNGLIVVNMMEFNNEDSWKVLYKLWFRGIREVVYNNQRYSIYYHPYVSGDTSTPRFEVNKLSGDEILNLDNELK